MKDSGIEWVGEVPTHWRVLPIRAVFAEVNEPGHSDARMLSVTISSGVIRQDELLEGTSKKDQSRIDKAAYKIVQPGDIAYNKMRAWQGAIGASEHRGIVSPAYIVQRPLDSTNSTYMHHLFRTPSFAKEAERYSYGITSDMWSLRPEHFKTIYVCVPPFTEQANIVRFLDHADRRIRRYIRAKEMLIALLEEQKQAIIHQAVTGQIDVRTGQPYPAYKPSGVEWLGDVPEIWNTIPLQRVTLDRCDGPFGSGLKSSHYVDEGIRVVRLQNIGHGEFNNSDIAFISPEHYATLGDHSVEPGDVLIAGLGDPNHPAGRACVVATSIGPAMVKADCFRFRLDRDLVDPKFISLQLTATARVASAILSTGATRQRTNLRSTLAKAIAIPSLHQQALIAEYARARALQIDSAKKATKKQIARFHEYRTRLIADVVTGKLDVREAAAALPEVDPLADDVEVGNDLGADETPAFDDDQEPAEVVA